VTEIVTDDEVEKALANLLKRARTASKAIAEAGYMDDYSKVVKARLMGQCNAKHATDKERHAYAHDDYQAHLRNLQTAVEKAEAEKFLIRVDYQVVEVWKALQYRNKRIESI
jgi:RNA binding exosome subunit